MSTLTAPAPTGAEVGNMAPDFDLNGSTGKIKLSSYRGKASVGLYFIREFGCMTCQAHASSLAKRSSDFKSMGVRLFVIGGGSLEDAKKMATNLKLPFPVLADTDRSTYAKFNLGKALVMLQKSATFLIDAGGIVRYAHRSALPAGSLEMDGLVKAASEISQATIISAVEDRGH